MKIIKLTITVVFLFAIHPFSIAQNHEFKWANGMGGLDRDETVAVACDKAGNTYTTGYFRGTVDFDPGSAVKNIKSQGKGDIFIQKFNSKGVMVWTKTIGSSNFEGGEEIEVDSDGNVYVTGQFETRLDFDPGAKQHFINSIGLFDAFLLKLDSKGDFIFAKGFGGFGLDYGQAVQVDKAKNIYVTGTYTVKADMNPDLGKWDYIKSVGKSDVFVVKLNSSGVYQWAKSMGGTSYERINDFKIDRYGNLHFIGHFLDTADFDPGSGTANLKTDPNIFTTFVVKLNSSGNYVWAKQLGTEINTFGASLAIDQSGNVYSTGSYSDTADFDPSSSKYFLKSNGSDDAYVVKLNSAGKFQWAKSLGGPSSELGEALEIAPNGNVVITGECRGRSDMNPGKDSFILNGKNHLTEAFVAVLDSKGDFVNAFTIAGNTRSIGRDITIDQKSQIHVCGTHQAGYLEIPIGKTKKKIPSVGGSLDGMVAVICQKTYGELSVTRCDSFTPPSGTAVWKKSGIYGDNIKNKAGCDSSIRINLTILNSSIRNVDTTSCDSFISEAGTPIFASGSLIDTSRNSLGCDSFDVYEVKMFYSSFLTDTVSECYKYKSKYSLKTWNKSGIYSDTAVNSDGCTLYLTHDITILEASDSQMVVGQCDSFVSPSGKYIWMETGIFYDTIPNAVACDSLITIDLTIGTEEYDTLALETCDSLVSPSGLYTWNKTGTYFDTVLTTLGCDSFLTVEIDVVIFNLSITSNWDTLKGHDTSAQYQWLDCDQNNQLIPGETNYYFVPHTTGNYAAALSKGSCNDTSNCFNLQVGSIDPLLHKNRITVYPNPTEGSLTIVIPEPQEISLSLFDFVGKEVHKQDVFERVNLDISHLQNGVYFLHVDGYARVKVIKK
jgi:hypothetical protein